MYDYVNYKISLTIRILIRICRKDKDIEGKDKMQEEEGTYRLWKDMKETEERLEH